VANKTLMAYIKSLKKPIFSTDELSRVSGKSRSAVSQGLSFLLRQGLITRVSHGLWYEGNVSPSLYLAVPYLLRKQRAYVSFTSALHIYGIIEQIPQSVTLASVAHTRKIRTAIGVFVVHRISPHFFKGFNWHKSGMDFLIAEPEKALADCFYVSAYKGKRFSYFPELYFPRDFSFSKVRNWIKEIKNPRVRIYAAKQLDEIIKIHGKSS